MQILFALGIVAITAVCWEFAEFAGDVFVYHSNYFQPSIGDTMKDLFLGLSGGLIASIFLSQEDGSKYNEKNN